jgi:NinB protein
MAYASRKKRKADDLAALQAIHCAGGAGMSEKLAMPMWNEQQGHQVVQSIWKQAKAHLSAGRRMVLELRPEKRSDPQNRRMWAMLGEIAAQVDWYGQKLTADDWKHVLSASLSKQRAVPGIDGGFVVLGLSTSKMSKAEMTDLQTLMEAFGAERGVKFSAASYVD